ncbi:MAG: DUF456 domain-containing protein [Phycisphaerae bacterium]|jgi:hypothetical protein
MIYLWSILLILINTICLPITAFALPGNWLMVITTTAFAWLLREQNFISVYTLIAITLLAFIGEVLEFFGGMGGAKRAGAGFWGSLGAIIGAITGAIAGTFLIPVPFIGTIAGSVLGAALGSAALTTAKGENKRTTIAMHAGLGQFIGSTMKLIAGVVIWFVVAVAAFWP